MWQGKSIDGGFTNSGLKSVRKDDVVSELSL